MKRMICILLALGLLLTIPVMPASASQTDQEDVFYGFIKVMANGSNAPEFYRAARDKNQVVYIHAGGFARIIGGTVTPTNPDSYTYRVGVWTIQVSCQQKQARLLYHPTGTTGFPLYQDFPLTECLYSPQENAWYLPMEQMLYLSIAQWYCLDGFVTVYRPETLLDLVPEIQSLCAENPDYTDLMGQDEQTQNSNSIYYGFMSSVDELGMTFIWDVMLNNLTFKSGYTFEDNILESVLFLLADDSPLENWQTDNYDLGIDSFDAASRFASSASAILDIKDLVKDKAMFEKIAKVLGTPLRNETLNTIAGVLETDISVGEQVADYVFSVANSLWTREYLPKNFHDRLIFLQNYTQKQTDDRFSEQLHRVASKAEQTYYEDIQNILSNNVTADHVVGLTNAVATLLGTETLLNTPMMMLSLIDFGVETIKQDPVCAPHFETAEQAHSCLYMLRTAQYMENVGNRTIGTIALDAMVNQEYLDTLRTSYQISQCLFTHAHKTLKEMGKLPRNSMTGGVELLLRLSASSRFDKLLLLTPDFSGITSDEAGCTREQIPPEYVYGGDGIFLCPVMQTLVNDTATTEIYTPEDFLKISNDMYGSYILMEDLTFNGWTPLGNSTDAFSGVLDGNGHSITINCSEYIPYSTDVYGGVFYWLNNAVVQNLHVKGDWSYHAEYDENNKQFYGNMVFGGISAYAGGTTAVYNCVSSVNIQNDASFWFSKNENLIGGIVGGISYNQSDVQISYCRNLGALSGEDYVAGIVCMAQASTITSCQNDGQITSDYYGGGIVNKTSGRVSGCANLGAVTGGSAAAGIATYVDYDGFIEDCINAGTLDVTDAPAWTGAIAEFSRGTVKNCINIGQRVGGVGGGVNGRMESPGKIISCYWDTPEEVQYRNADGNPVDDSDITLGKITFQQMINPDTFAEFDFLTVWTFREGMRCPYPSALLYNGQTPPMAEDSAQ